VSAGRRNPRRDFRSLTHHIAILMQEHPQWTHSNVWSQLATTAECSFKIEDWQSEKKLWTCDLRTICNATRVIDAGCGDIRHRGVSDSSHRAPPRWRSHSAWMEMSFADDTIATVSILSGVFFLSFDSSIGAISLLQLTSVISAVICCNHPAESSTTNSVSQY